MCGERLICNLGKRMFTFADRKVEKSLVYPSDFDIAVSIDYFGDGDYWHKLDLARPQGDETDLPLIVNIHGGGGFYGSKDIYYKYYGIMLARGGYAVATINYPLYPDADYEQQVRSVITAVNFLSANCEALGINKNRIYLTGDSHGACLCATVAEICANKEYQKETQMPCNFKITALGLSHGVYDTASLAKSNVIYKTLIKCALDSIEPEKHPFYKYVSPMRLLSEDFPPTFSVSSLYDKLSPQSVELSALLDLFKVPNKCVFYPKEMKLPHVFNVQGESELNAQIRSEMLDFFNKAAKA